MGIVLLLILALAAAVALNTGNYWILGGTFLALSVYGMVILPIINKRKRRQWMADLRKRNRGNIDLQSGWIKKTWQHDEGECKREKVLLIAKIEAYAAKSATERRT